VVEHHWDPPPSARPPDEHRQESQCQDLCTALTQYGCGERAKRVIGPVRHN
jgi:hypothetical protein